MLRRTIVPIGALYSGTLWLGNAAYLFLSVSFIQMLKVGLHISLQTYSTQNLTDCWPVP